MSNKADRDFNLTVNITVLCDNKPTYNNISHFKLFNN